MGLCCPHCGEEVSSLDMAFSASAKRQLAHLEITHMEAKHSDIIERRLRSVGIKPESPVQPEEERPS